MKPHKLSVGLLGLSLFLIYFAFSPGRIIAFDVAVRQEVAHALWTRLSVFVPSPNAIEAGLVSTPHGLTTFYGMGQVLALIPFDWMGRLLSHEPSSWTYLPTAVFYVPLFGVLWWLALSACLGQLGFTKRASYWGTALFSLTTIMLVYSSQTAQEESLVGTLVLFALAFWLKAQHGAVKPAVLAGLFAGLAVLVRLNAALALLPLLGVTLDSLRERRFSPKTLGLACAGTLPGLTLLVAFSYWRFGSPWATGYAEAVKQGLGVYWVGLQPEVFLGVLFGWGKGLFILSPPLLLAAFGLGACFHRRPFQSAATIAALLLSALISGFILNNPDGSESWGARYQVHLIGFLAPAVFLGARTLYKAGLQSVVWTFGLAGLGIQILACTAPDALEYTQNDLLGHSRTSLITARGEGQLGLRLQNVSTTLSGGAPLLADDPSVHVLLKRYTPNVWGFSLHQKLGTAGGLASLFLWALTLFLGIRLLFIAAGLRLPSLQSMRFKSMRFQHEAL